MAPLSQMKPLKLLCTKMKELAIIFCLLLMGFAARSQSDTLRLFCEFGLGYSRANYQYDLEPKYALDIFPFTKLDAVDVNIALGWRFANNIEMELDYLHKSLSVSRSQFDQTHRERHPSYFLYHDFDLDETNSTLTGFRYNGFLLGANYRLNLSKNLALLPGVKLGVAAWDHRDYSFVLREANSNQFSEFIVQPKFNPQLSYKAGVKFLFNTSIPCYLDIYITRSSVSIEYEVKNDMTEHTQEKIDVQAKSTFLSVGIGIRPFLSSIITE